jgi:hypothetical protein
MHGTYLELTICQMKEFVIILNLTRILKLNGLMTLLVILHLTLNNRQNKQLNHI